MPDLIMEARRTCRSNVRWQRKYASSSQAGVEYTVRYGPVSGGEFSHGFACDCPAGTHGRKCRHVKQAEADRCGWGWEAFAGSDPQPAADGSCPECGGPVEGIRVGV